MAAAEPELPVLALNSGSSSLKFGLYELAGAEPRLLLSGEAEAIGAAESRFSAKDAAGTILVFDRDAIADVAQALIRIIATLAQFKTVGPAVICVSSKAPPALRHCTRRRHCRSFAWRKAIFPVWPRPPASTRTSMLQCPIWPASCRCRAPC